MKTIPLIRRKSSAKTQGVFLHTGWRTAGTWVWSRFRALPDVRAFYEPFHDVLASNRATLETVSADTWESGHPAGMRPYFSEYLPLLSDGHGVQHYDADFEIDRFDLPDQATSIKLQTYLESLLDSAGRDGRIAVMKFCRSMGRMRWMMDTYPDATHVVVVRNPAAQWASAWQQMKKSGNAWFVAAPYRMLAANLHNERVRRALLALDCQVRPESVAPPATAVMQQVRAQPAEVSYRAFLVLWVLNTMTISPRVSAIVDCDLLGLSKHYGEQCARHLHLQTGLDVNFDDAHALPVSCATHNPQDWLGFDAEAAFRMHAAADRFVRAEIGHDPAESLAAAVTRSKLAMANQQALLGGLAWQPAPEQLENPLRYGTDLLAFQSMSTGGRPNSSPSIKSIVSGAWGSAVDSLQNLASKPSRKWG